MDSEPPLSRPRRWAMIDARRRLNLRQDQLGALLDVSKATVSAIENGQAPLPDEDAQRLATVLGVQPATLQALTDRGTETPPRVR